MFLLTGLLALAWWEILVAVVVLGILVASISFERGGMDGASGWKWLAFIVIVAAVFFVSDLPFTFATFTSGALWLAVGEYYGIGLLYSLVEFFFAVLRSASKYKEEWDNYISTRPGNSNLFMWVKNGKPLDQWSSVSSEVREFIGYQNKRNSLINLDVTVNTEFKLEPVVNKGVLVQRIMSWSILWPAYAVSLVLGDVLERIVRMVVDLTHKFSTGFVRAIFRRVFTI